MLRTQLNSDANRTSLIVTYPSIILGKLIEKIEREGERERGGERDRETERQRDRETQTERHTERHRDTERDRETQTERQGERVTSYMVIIVLKVS